MMGDYITCATYNDAVCILDMKTPALDEDALVVASFWALLHSCECT